MKSLGIVACGVFVAGSLILASPAALAQRPPHSGGGGARVAAPAGGGGGGHAQVAPRASRPSGGGYAQAVPRGSRPSGGRPVVGTAVPRGSVPGYHPPNHYPYYRPYYGGYYGYPYYGYGYGYPYYGYGYGWGWGIGLSFYYSPYWWGFGAPWYGYAPYGGYGYPYWGYGPYGSYESGYGGGGAQPAESPTGQIELKVKPKEAQVYVDGYFVGSVEDFQGWGKRLTVKAAPEPGQVHKIEFRYPGYETLSFEVSMTPGQSITYRGELTKTAQEQPKR